MRVNYAEKIKRNPSNSGTEVIVCELRQNDMYDGLKFQSTVPLVKEASKQC